MFSDPDPADTPRCTKIAPVAAAPVDQVTLTYQDRYRRRCRLVSDGGRAIILDLAELTELRDGSALILDSGDHVAIRAAAEPLAAISAAGADLARLAWHIGNRHTPCQIGPDRILIQRDHVLEDMLRGLGATVSHVDAPFQPEGGAYGHGRTHGHAHSHDPHEDPNAHIDGDRGDPRHHHHG